MFKLSPLKTKWGPRTPLITCFFLLFFLNTWREVLEDHRPLP